MSLQDQLDGIFALEWYMRFEVLRAKADCFRRVLDGLGGPIEQPPIPWWAYLKLSPELRRELEFSGGPQVLMMLGEQPLPPPEDDEDEPPPNVPWV